MRFATLSAALVSVMLVTACSETPTTPEVEAPAVASFNHHTPKSGKKACIKEDDSVKGPTVVYVDSSDSCPDGYTEY